MPGGSSSGPSHRARPGYPALWIETTGTAQSDKLIFILPHLPSTSGLPGSQKEITLEKLNNIDIKNNAR